MNRAIIGLATCAIAVTLGLPSYAQDTPAQNSAPIPDASAQSSPASTEAAASQPSKKVWTNEDLTELHSSSEISSIGRTGVRNDRQTGQTTAGPRRSAAWYRNQITRLKTQLAALDTQIAQLQTTINGTPTGDAKISTRPTGVKGGTWQAELVKAQAKRDDVAGQIDALRDEARHDGVAPNTLP